MRASGFYRAERSTGRASRGEVGEPLEREGGGKASLLAAVAAASASSDVRFPVRHITLALRETVRTARE